MGFSPDTWPFFPVECMFFPLEPITALLPGKLEDSRVPRPQ